MRLRFGPDDADAFEATRDELVTRFADWAAAHPERAEGADPGDVGTLLDWRWGYDDGELAAWTTRHVEEFLLAWCPRKIAAPPDLLAALPATVDAFVRFLADTGLLDPRSDPVELLDGIGADLLDDFIEAMGDPSRFGLGKSILGAMGVQPDDDLDEQTLAEVMEQFNALPEEMRRAITDPALAAMAGNDALAPLPMLPPVRLPGDAERRASAAAAPVLGGFRTFAEHCGATGITLTKTGNLRLADADVLARRLGTGESVEREHGGRTWKVRSSAEMGHLHLWFQLALEVGALRRHRGRIVAVAAFEREVGDDPESVLGDAVDVVLDEIGILVSFYESSRRDTDVHELIDAGVDRVLADLLTTDEPISFDEIVDLFESALEITGLLDQWTSRDTIAFWVDLLLTWVERLGLITQVGVEKVEDRYGIARRQGGLVTLTPVGVSIAVGRARGLGFEVPIIGEMAESSAFDLASMLGVLDPDDGADEARAWLAARADDADALAALVEALVAVAEPVELSYVLTMLEQVRPGEVAPLVARHRDGPSGPSVTMWLVEQGALDGEEVAPEVVVHAAFDVFASTLDVGAVDELVELFRADQPVEGQVEVLGRLWQTEHPRAAEVFDALGRSHPDRAVAKAARRAAVQHRSWLANRR